MIKLIACDVDGTILDDEKKIDPGLKEVVDKLKEKGIRFTLVSGRNIELLEKICDYFDIGIPYVCNNGGSLYQNGRLLSVQCVPSDRVNDAARLLYDNDIPFIAYCIEENFVNKNSDFFKNRTKGLVMSYKEYSSDLDLSAYQVVKITADFHGCEEKIEDLQKIISSYPETSFVRMEPGICCINKSSANKGDGLKMVCEHLGIDMKKEVMSFGDNENDLPMLKGSKISVGVRNSEEIVKENVDYVCSDNNHSGVSLFLKEYFKDCL